MLDLFVINFFDVVVEKFQFKLSFVEKIKDISYYLCGMIFEELQEDFFNFGKDSIQLFKYYGIY